MGQVDCIPEVRSSPTRATESRSKEVGQRSGSLQNVPSARPHPSCSKFAGGRKCERPNCGHHDGSSFLGRR